MTVLKDVWKKTAKVDPTLSPPPYPGPPGSSEPHGIPPTAFDHLMFAINHYVSVKRPLFKAILLKDPCADLTVVSTYMRDASISVGILLLRESIGDLSRADHKYRKEEAQKVYKHVRCLGKAATSISSRLQTLEKFDTTLEFALCLASVVKQIDFYLSKKYKEVRRAAARSSGRLHFLIFRFMADACAVDEMFGGDMSEILGENN